jgi:glutamate-1-semialdehyde 2,1-aminomutase
MNNPRYDKSTSHLTLAESFIPLGSQTFSKSRTQYPVGISPLFIKKAKGCLTWDVDGNRYIDLVNSLAAITLGYRDPSVDKAVRKQVKSGTIFSLPGKLEYEVAEKIVDLVPSAELVRFGKNGSDATSAAVRLARAFTGRKIIAVCGYHGWQDWYIGSTSRNKGVPEEVSNLTASFIYNDIDSLNKIFATHQNDVAAVILEPMNSSWPSADFLRQLREMCTKNGSILIFDETITGFRFSKGGAQELFNVTPDLTTLGKGLANGYPLSAIAGKREIMLQMNEIFYSGTFGGELLSLAAANVVLSKHQKNEVVPRLVKNGKKLVQLTLQAINENKLSEVLRTSGHETWIFLNWSDSTEFSSLELKTYFMQECFKLGVLVLSTHNVSAVMNSKQINQVGSVYSQVLSKMKKHIESGTLRHYLEAEPLTPLFKVR